jgi:uncharacterized membrane protein YkoI
MKLRPFALGLTVAALTIGCQHMNTEHDEEGEENEVKMTLDQAPPAVREALQREAGGAAIAEVDKEDHDGRTAYEVDVKKDGKNWEIIVDENGKLISKKLDEDDDKGEKGEKEDKD